MRSELRGCDMVSFVFAMLGTHFPSDMHRHCQPMQYAASRYLYTLRDLSLLFCCRGIKTASTLTSLILYSTIRIWITKVATQHKNHPGMPMIRYRILRSYTLEFICRSVSWRFINVSGTFEEKCWHIRDLLAQAQMILKWHLRGPT